MPNNRLTIFLKSELPRSIRWKAITLLVRACLNVFTVYFGTIRHILEMTEAIVELNSFACRNAHMRRNNIILGSTIKYIVFIAGCGCVFERLRHRLRIFDRFRSELVDVHRRGRSVVEH